QQTNTIGVIVPDIKNEFFSSIVSEIEEYFFEEKNYTVFICNTNGNANKELDYLASLDSKGVDGLIYISGNDDMLHTSMRRDIPVVCIDRKPTNNSEITIVESDNFDGGLKATNHLIAKGCKKIVVLKGHKEISTARDRFRGYCEAMRQSDFSLNEELIVNLDKTNFESARNAIDYLIKKEIEFDGIFAINDWLALGALYALKDNNFSVPEKVKIVGFDNVSISKYSYPSLTTIAQDKEQLGYTAAKELLKLITSSDSLANKSHFSLPVSLVERGTT
ncbi:LacI family transcriptional regulator, partial [Staphylococcus simulans]